MPSRLKGTMESSGTASSTSRLTVTVPLPMYSTQRLSVNRMSMGICRLPRTRAKQGRSHRRSTDRLLMSTSMLLERQDSNVIGGTGVEVGGASSVSALQPQPVVTTWA